MDEPAPAIAASDASTGAVRSDVPATVSGILGPILMAGGGILCGAAIALALTVMPAEQATTPSLDMVARDQIEAALLSLAPQSAGALAGDARQCKVPLASVTVATSTTAGAPQTGTIRIRSGSYLSPPIVVGPAPQRVAIPFPAPYPTGKGVLVVEGAARGLNVWLTPGSSFAQIDGPAPINVVWTPKTPPC